MSDIIKKFFFEYLEEQFKEVIMLNGKYSSGLFTTIEGIFLKESINNFFDLQKNLFDLKKIFFLT